MLILLEHVEYFKWEASDVKEQHRNALPHQLDHGSLGMSLVAFINVESCDVSGGAKAASKAAREIRNIAGEVGVANIVIYPFAHLSYSDHASQDAAVEVLGEIAKALICENPEFNVVSVPFGCSKMREAKVFGHQKAVLLRSVR